MKSLSRVWLFVTPWTVAYQAPPSMGFSRQEYWSGLPLPSPGDLPDPGTEPGSPALEADALTSEPPGKQSCLQTQGPDKVRFQVPGVRTSTSCSGGHSSTSNRHHRRHHPKILTPLGLSSKASATRLRSHLDLGCPDSGRRPRVAAEHTDAHLRWRLSMNNNVNDLTF